MYKRNRSMTVGYTTCDEHLNSVPSIKIKGKWLEDLGFEIGDKITVECQEEQLIITKSKNI